MWGSCKTSPSSGIWKGKILKKVSYFLAESEYRELMLEKSGGLDGARWFQLSEIPELRMYNDIIPLISKAIEIISKQAGDQK